MGIMVYSLLWVISSTVATLLSTYMVGFRVPLRGSVSGIYRVLLEELEMFPTWRIMGLSEQGYRYFDLVYRQRYLLVAYLLGPLNLSGMSVL